MGVVYLVGAGPGDEGLFTVRGRALLESADCVVYDRLGAPGLLGLTKPGCECIDVGKTAGHHTMRQAQIEELLIQKAAQHAVVVRLKGGDPFVFGRGGEELATLRRAGVAAEVVPGVSSALAGPASEGIPLTHRGVAAGFRVMTAQDKNGQIPPLDFEGMARTGETLVFLMSLSRVGELAERLLSAGKCPDTPAAVLSNATMPGADILTAPLNEIGAALAKRPLPSPGMLVVGDVVALRDTLCGGKLSGRRFLVPVIGPAPSRLAPMLRAEGARVVEYPVGRIVLCPKALTRGMLERASALVFTSRHGAEGFFAGLDALTLDSRALAGKRLYTVGEATAEALCAHGLRADGVANPATSHALGELLCRELTAQDCVLLARAAGLGEDALCQTLGAHCAVMTAEVYENLPCEGQRVPGEADSLCFASASAVHRTVKTLGTAALAGRRLYAIGPKTANALSEYGFAAVTAKQNDLQGLVCAILRDSETPMN